VQAIGTAFIVREIGELQLKGKHKLVRAYEVIGRKEPRKPSPQPE
jgi:class 3 adenylate cyclase